jgi:hypothetical protein
MKLGFASTKCGSWYPSQRFDRHFVAAHLSRDGLEVLRRGDDFDGSKGVRWQERSHERYHEYPFVHHPNLSLYQETQRPLVPLSERVCAMRPIEKRN